MPAINFCPNDPVIREDTAFQNPLYEGEWYKDMWSTTVLVVACITTWLAH